MAKSASQKPAPNAADIEFLQFHKPPLKAGNYIATVSQTVTSSDKNKAIAANDTFSAVQTFSIAGERFTLKPAEILSIFPPASSSGDHAYVLPHLIFSRSTLPWEREGQPQMPDVPWLGLLLFDAAEAPSPQIVTYKDLFATDAAKINYPSLDHEPGDLLPDHDDEKVVVIDIPFTLAQAIIPSAAELSLLTHVRQWQEAGADHKNVDAERAVCIANRLPGRGRSSVVHLVSFENRYNTQGQFDFGSANLPVRLVSLKSWRFSCLNEEAYKLTAGTEGRLKTPAGKPGLAANKWALLKASPLFDQEVVGSKQFQDQVEETLQKAGQYLSDDESGLLLRAARYKKLTFKSLLMELDRDQFRLPSSALQVPAGSPDTIQQAAEHFRQRSYVPLPYHLRNGQRGAVWYHGPLQAETTSLTLPLPARSADDLLRFYDSFGMFDSSYAAAWELGRLLTLRNKRVARELFVWKRTHAQYAKEIDTLRAQFDHLPFQPVSKPYQLPDIITGWFHNLALLKNIPFNYLVPNERMLPVESIRFFTIDTGWIEALLDGAFSIGRVSAAQQQQDSQFVNADPANRPARLGGSKANVAGFLIRSDVVAGWPNLQVAAYSQAFAITADAQQLKAASLPLLCQERLSANTMIVLFEGMPQAVDIHQKPEVLHFGVSEPDPEHTQPYKRLRDANGIETAKTITADFKGNLAQRVLDCVKMAGDLQKASGSGGAPTSAGFALQMIEGVERVRFNAG